MEQKVWLNALVQWAVDRGLDETNTWGQMFGESTPEATLQQVLHFLHGTGARFVSTQDTQFDSVTGVAEPLKMGWLAKDVVVMGYRMARVAQMVGAVYGHKEGERMTRDILLVLGIALRLPHLREGVLEIAGNPQGKVIPPHTPLMTSVAMRLPSIREKILKVAGMREERDLAGDLGYTTADKLAGEVAAELQRRHQQVLEDDTTPIQISVEDASHMLLLDATAMAAVAYFEDMAYSEKEIQDVERVSLEQTRLLLRLTLQYLRVRAHPEPAQMHFVRRLAILTNLPQPAWDNLMVDLGPLDWKAYLQAFPEADERLVLLECLLTMPALEENPIPAEMAFCQDAARNLEINEWDVTGVEGKVRRDIARPVRE